MGKNISGEFSKLSLVAPVNKQKADAFCSLSLSGRLTLMTLLGLRSELEISIPKFPVRNGVTYRNGYVFSSFKISSEKGNINESGM